MTIQQEQQHLQQLQQFQQMQQQHAIPEVCDVPPPRSAESAYRTQAFTPDFPSASYNSLQLPH